MVRRLTPMRADSRDSDFAVQEFLNFIDKDLNMHFVRPSRLSKTSINRAIMLTREVAVNDSEVLPRNVTF